CAVWDDSLSGYII
nr:immunoglobulin light chain junction region [Macaca mulatta]